MYYRPIQSITERTAIFERMNAEGLTSMAMSAHKNPSLKFWLDITAPERCIFLGCFNEADVLMGCATFSGFRGKSYEFDFTAFREFFGVAVDMARGGFAWIFSETDCESIIGLAPITNRHAVALARECGFVNMGKISGACFVARKNKYVDGVMLCVTPETLQAKELGMGFGGGGGYSAPEAPKYVEPEKPQVQKPVTEAATAARDSQKEKANKAAGIQASILTSPVQETTTTTTKTLLGQ